MGIAALRAGAAALLAVGLALPAAADEAALLEKIEQLEQRIRDLEANRARPERSSRASRWTDRVRIGASGNAGYYGGQRNSGFDPDSFLVWDARLFVDAALGEDVRVAEREIFRNLGFSFEWNLVRLGEIENDVGDFYVDFQGFMARDWLNFQVGRFQIPVGEAYLRYGRGYADKPFVSNSFGPWWWDEGVRLYGSDREDRLGWVASISDGDTPFNADSDGDKQVTLKLFWRPSPWLYLSASALRSGEIGSASSPAMGALWLGETWARAFGAGTGVPSFQGGVEVPDGPNQLDETWLAAGDAVVELQDRLRLWLAYGRYSIESAGDSSYDRVLHYWIAELLLRGAWASEVLRPFYVGVRANALGSWDSGEGYLLDSQWRSTLGFNMESLSAYSAVAGWELTQNLRLRAEFTHRDIGLVGGASSLRDAASDIDSFAVEVGAAF
jgi:hypothetical protein